VATHDGDEVSQHMGGASAPLLSVTVLNYNYAHFLTQCLDSILSQTRADFELILINDCSTDNSLEVIQPYLADPRVRLIDHKQNKGYIASLIEGSKLSRGEYITVISADDFCISNRAFANLLAPMLDDDEVVLAYAAHGHYDSDSVRRYLRRPYPKSYARTGTEEFRELALENYILHSGTIIRRTAYEAVGGYDPTVRYAPDSNMWLLLCGQGKVAYCADELYAYRVHNESMSISTKGIRIGMQEGLAGTERAFAVMRGRPGIDRALFVKAMKRSLVAVATDDIFAGRLKGGWYAYWCALRVHPIWTVFQRPTVVLVARTLLGPNGFQSLRSVLRRHPREIAPA
jgi:glycosyltransferase involved in cell wall biosynthesis